MLLHIYKLTFMSQVGGGDGGGDMTPRWETTIVPTDKKAWFWWPSEHFAANFVVTKPDILNQNIIFI